MSAASPRKKSTSVGKTSGREAIARKPESEPPGLMAAEPTVKQPGTRGPRVVEAVLRAALSELARVGFLAMSIEEVAARAQVNKTTVYRRWPTKSDLVADALRSVTRDLKDPDTGTLRGDLVQLVLNMSEFASSPVGRSVIWVLLGPGAESELVALTAKLRRDEERRPKAIISRAIARGELPEQTEPELIIGMLFGAVLHRVVMDHKPTSPARAARLVELMLGGVLRSAP